jgi:hypothetical protein
LAKTKQNIIFPVEVLENERKRDVSPEFFTEECCHTSPCTIQSIALPRCLHGGFGGKRKMQLEGLSV